MNLAEVHALLLGIRDREAWIGRIDPADGRAVLFFPGQPVPEKGLISAWLVGEGHLHAAWRYFANTSRPTTDEERKAVNDTANFHFSQYPERVGLRLERDYSALRELRSGA